ncbi:MULTISPECIES: hypothetical protein [unclassified Aureimonas]|uniref:hypothetical protein n=1 Tax=unclassified Aureimonas TaxID=2615206 RepID=UPI0007206105|nr:MULTISPECIES: hypothetical protein [unclassified Aureimonas]ALN72710.1 hypothetical protein M673_08295 [Aureimonas sp. AU20]
MSPKLSAALVLATSVLGASGAMAATQTTHHPLHRAVHPVVERTPTQATRPVQVMSEKPVANPSLNDVFSASDGALYSPMVNDPRTHGLPNL